MKYIILELWNDGLNQDLVRGVRSGLSGPSECSVVSSVSSVSSVPHQYPDTQL